MRDLLNRLSGRQSKSQNNLSLNNFFDDHYYPHILYTKKTHDHDRYTYGKHFRLQLGKFPINKIDNKVADDWVRQQIAAGYKNSTINKHINMLVRYPVHITNPTAQLFFSAKRGGFSAQTIVNLFQRFYKLAAIRGASSHSGRRQFLTELADKGINVRVIMALARHKDISTTMKYIDFNESKLRNAIELV